MHILAKTLPAALLLLPLAAVPTQAAEAGRYQLIETSSGFVRLDQQTGALVYCRDSAGELSCRAVDIAALPRTGELPLTGQERSPAASEEKSDSGLEDFERALTAVERMMKNLMSMSKDTERDCAL